MHASAARPGQRAANQVTRQLRRTILTEVGLRHCRVGCAPRPTETTVLHGGKKLGQPGSLGADEASCRETTPCLHLGPRRKKNVGRSSRQTKRSLISLLQFLDLLPHSTFQLVFCVPECYSCTYDDIRRERLLHTQHSTSIRFQTLSSYYELPSSPLNTWYRYQVTWYAIFVSGSRV